MLGRGSGLVGVRVSTGCGHVCDCGFELHFDLFNKEVE